MIGLLSDTTSNVRMAQSVIRDVHVFLLFSYGLHSHFSRARGSWLGKASKLSFQIAQIPLAVYSILYNLPRLSLQYALRFEVGKCCRLSEHVHKIIM